MSVKKVIGSTASKAQKIKPAKFQFSGTKGDLASKSSTTTKMLQNAAKSAEALQKARRSAIKDMNKDTQQREKAKKNKSAKK